MNDQAQTEIEQKPADVNDGWEWMLVEIMGHRTHWGRGREEERFGAKMLRVDVPRFISFERTYSAAPAVVFDPPRIEWSTHYYSGASIFSFTLTDERTVMAKNKPYEPPARYSLPPPGTPDDRTEDGEDEDFDGDDDAGG
jgi:hypothetical protein